MNRTYEMLWDCSHCGTRKNLGLTHRHCPMCGAAQDAAARYFPSDAEKVAVEDHQLVGADKKCIYCSALSSRNARHCCKCGGPLDEATDAVRRADQVSAQGFAGESLEDARREHQGIAAPQAPPPKKKGSLFKKLALGCVGTLLFSACVITALFVFWKREGTMVVTGHTWSRDIQVERFGPVEESEWCDRVPAGGRVTRQSREVRDHRQIPDGQDCQTRRTDNGNGTFTETQECTPRYREEPIYDQKCYYTIDRWTVARTAHLEGASVEQLPAWPVVQLASQGQCVGCEREGARTETYTVHFTEPSSGETATCSWDQARWQTFTVGSQWDGELSVIGDVLDCDSLAAH